MFPDHRGIVLTKQEKLKEDTVEQYNLPTTQPLSIQWPLFIGPFGQSIHSLLFNRSTTEMATKARL